MSESSFPIPPKQGPHGLAIREGSVITVEQAKDHPYHAATYDCKCGRASYRIFVDQVHYSDGQRFQGYVKKFLENLHAQNTKHPDVIEIPMEAEFSN